MRSTITIFIIGFLLGSTLGIGGIYTQVLQPAWHELEQLEQENGVMEKALEDAGNALHDAAGKLRGEDGPSPLSIHDIFSGVNEPAGATGKTTRSVDEPTTLSTEDRKVLADQLSSLAKELEAARKK